MGPTAAEHRYPVEADDSLKLGLMAKHLVEATRLSDALFTFAHADPLREKYYMAKELKVDHHHAVANYISPFITPFVAYFQKLHSLLQQHRILHWMYEPPRS